MCSPSQIASYLLADLFRRGGENRQVFFIMTNEQAATEADSCSLEAIIAFEGQMAPEKVLRDYCKVTGRDANKRHCHPIITPEGFLANGIRRDFKVVHEGSDLRIAFG